MALGIEEYMTQPHFILAPTLRQHIDKLKTQVQETNLRAPTRPTKPISLINHYIHQITTWIVSMTDLQRQRTYTLEEIIALAGLKGHFRSRASNQFTGEALRRSNFYPKRDWTNSGRNKRYWKLKKETT